MGELRFPITMKKKLSFHLTGKQDTVHALLPINFYKGMNGPSWGMQFILKRLPNKIKKRENIDFDINIFLKKALIERKKKEKKMLMGMDHYAWKISG